jgi:hypothetical protein
MRCYICDAAIEPDEVELDARYLGQKYGPVVPCVTCEIEISEIFPDFTDTLDPEFPEEDEKVLDNTPEP